MKIDTTLRQWCPDCLKVTRTVRCPTCSAGGPSVFICARCRSGHDTCDREDD